MNNSTYQPLKKHDFYFKNFTWNWVLFALIILIIASYFRIIMIQETEVIVPIRADALEYYNYAYNLQNYGIYSLQDFNNTDSLPVADSVRPPGYALFLLPFLEQPPNLAMVAKIQYAQVLLSVITLLLAIFIFRSFLNWSGTLVGAFLIAISPHLIAANVYVLTETLFTFFLIAFWAMTLAFSQKAHWLKALLAGVCLALALLVKPTMQYFLIFLVPATFLMLAWRQALNFSLIIILGFSLLYAPWMIRNASLPQAESPKALDTVHKGMYPDLMYKNDRRTYGFPNRVDPTWEERSKSSSKVLAEIQRRFVAEPARYLYWYLIGKPIMFFSWSIIAGFGDVFIYPVTTSPYHQVGIFDLSSRLMQALHWPVTILALISCLLIWLPQAKKWLPEAGLFAVRMASLIIGYFLLVHIAGTPLPRYSIPLRPLLFGLSLLSVALIIQWFIHYLQPTPKE